jgi:hypothetical protein
MIRRSTWCARRVALVLVSLAAACADPNEPAPTGVPPTVTSPPASPSPPPTYWSGAWAGTTSEGLPISFTVVDNDSVDDLSISIKLTGNCGISQTKITVTGRAGGLLDQLLFVGDSTSLISLRGTFSDYSNISGTATSNYLAKLDDGSPCRSIGSVSWSAKIQ